MGEITLGLNQRTRVVKNYVDWAHSKRIDVMPSTFLGWLESQGYLNADAIREDLEKEREELEDVCGE